jgi:hypothetical protein
MRPVGVALFVVAVSHLSAAATLCTPVEQVVFSCSTTKNKIVSLCSSSLLTDATGYLQYRFGVAGKAPELSYPTTPQHPRNFFQSGTLMFSGGGGAYLKFSNDNYDYAVFTGIGKGWKKEGVVVQKAGKPIAYLQCRGPWTSQLGPDWFDKVKIQTDPHASDFEIP